MEHRSESPTPDNGSAAVPARVGPEAAEARVTNIAVPSLPPPLPQGATPKPAKLQRVLSIGLSVFLGLLLVHAVVSLIDDSLLVLWNRSFLSSFRQGLSPFAVLLMFVTYCLMAATPMVPKRFFLPVALFGPVAVLAGIPFLIYARDRVPMVEWLMSACELALVVAVCYWLRRDRRVRWPLVPAEILSGPRFTWRNMIQFLAVNLLVVGPLILGYLLVCGASAVSHFSDGFVRLRPNGLLLESRKYVRDDGKTVQLVAMAHVGDASFYRTLSQSFPTNATVLIEGVTDRHHLLTNHISYKRMAQTLKAAEQQTEFRPSGHIVSADVDVAEFSTNTLDLLNLAMLVHSRGLNRETLMRMMQYPDTPDLEEVLFDDLLRKRNAQVIKELHARLPRSDEFVIPWGAAHMPGLARELQRSGFRVAERQARVAFRF